MGSCEGFEVHGMMRNIPGSKEIVLQLQPSNSSLLEELCGFCGEKWDTSAADKHTHFLKGSFSFILKDNNFIFSLAHSNEIVEDLINDHELEQQDSIQAMGAEKDIIDTTIEDSSTDVLQYEVNNKIFKLKSIPTKSAIKSSSSKLQSSTSQSKKQPTHLKKKTIEFVIDGKTYSSSSAITNKSSEENWPMDDADVQNVENNVESSLEILQVRLMELSIVPEYISCGPDTATFLQNMKELARLVANNQTLFKCEQCGEEMTSYFPFIEHSIKHLQTRPYCCILCQSTFQTRAVMRHHLDMHGGKTPFECDFCGKKFRNSCHMKQHRMRHTGERPHPCPHCSKTFAHKNVLKIHLQSHTGQKPCCCDLCGKLFREPHRLATHLATHRSQNDSSSNLECSTCGKSFKTTGMLKVHQTKRCKGYKSSMPETQVDTTEEIDETLVTLQDAASVEIDNENQLLGPEHEITVIETETLEDGTMETITMVPGTYIVEPSGEGAMLVQFYQDDC